MTENASPNHRPPFFRAAAAATALALTAGAAGAYQVGVRADRAPSFERGGEFLTTSDIVPPGAPDRPFPYGDATTATAAATSSTGTAPPPVTPAPPASTADPAPSSPRATVPPAPDLLAAPRPPATGTYTFAVSGSEGATGFGSRRYPDQATLVIHRASDVGPDELVHDLRLSPQHEERAVVRYQPTGVAYSFEGGSITFGPGTQTSQASYAPRMVQVPFPLSPGATASGSSEARDGSGRVTRVEQWRTEVVGEEVLDVLGQQRRTWVVDVQRTTPRGSTEEVDRHRRYWFDPQLGTWVRWTERFHGARRVLLDFTYDTEYTATLVGFRPG